MVGIGTSMEVAFELRPKRQEERGRNISAGGEAVVYSVLYLLPGVSKNSSVVVYTVSFLWLFITCSGRIQKWLPPAPKSHFYFHLLCHFYLFGVVIFFIKYHILPGPLQGLVRAVIEFPMHFQSPSAFHELLTLLLATHQYTAGTTQAFNSIESFSWYKLLSFTIIFNTLTHRIQ